VSVSGPVEILVVEVEDPSEVALAALEGAS
jgi:hypothetical protein